MAKNDCVLLDGILDDRVSSKYPSDKRDEAFEYLVFEQLLKDYDLSPDEIESGSIDGRQDGGIDGFFIFVNGHLLSDPEAFIWPKTGSDLQIYIISCKHHDTYKQAVLDNLAASLSELLNLAIDDKSLNGPYSDSLLRFRNNLLYSYRKLSPRINAFTINVVYASRGDTSSIGEEVVSRSDQIVGIINEYFSTCNVAFKFIGSTELIELHRKVPSYSLELEFIEALSKGERYILLAKLHSYYLFLNDNGKLRRYLFESNIRDFMGLNRVNEDIKLTLENYNSPDFWWLNNGVTMIVSDARVIGKTIQMQDIQIVNGLQTSESIYHYFLAGGTDPNERSVLIKILVVKDDKIRDEIILATNNQTNVELASLHATDKIQRDIEDILYRQDLFYERRKNYYINLGHSPSEIITPLYIAAGYLNLVLKKPHRAVSLKSRFMRNTDSYQQIFSQDAPIEIWPKVAKILKTIDSHLEVLRPVSSRSDKFLKNWRQILAFLAISEYYKKYNFSIKEVIDFNIDYLTFEKVKELFYQLQSYPLLKSVSDRWNSKSKVFLICRILSDKKGIEGISILENMLQDNTEDTRDGVSIQVTKEFLGRLKSVMPKQPWKPGLHKEISELLHCSVSQYFKGVRELIEDGYFYRQKDGVLYDKDGNIVSFDPDRVKNKSRFVGE